LPGKISTDNRNARRYNPEKVVFEIKEIDVANLSGDIKHVDLNGIDQHDG
jgi:hypothetical protein